MTPRHVRCDTRDGLLHDACRTPRDSGVCPLGHGRTFTQDVNYGVSSLFDESTRVGFTECFSTCYILPTKFGGSEPNMSLPTGFVVKKVLRDSSECLCISSGRVGVGRGRLGMDVGLKSLLLT